MVTAHEVRTRLRSFIGSELLTATTIAFDNGDPLFSAGLLDSFALAEIGVWLEEELGLYIPDGELTVERMDSVDQIVSRALAAANP